MNSLEKLDEEISFTLPPIVRKRNEQCLRDSGYAPSEPVILDLEDKLKQSLVAILDGFDAEFDVRFRNIEPSSPVTAPQMKKNTHRMCQDLEKRLHVYSGK